ncbi:hypothetical protein FQR65_LT18229 [Abscondita terminalis]|nr:hypothetical protein FQR65_LT18229 [Abscondita terminalis]
MANRAQFTSFDADTAPLLAEAAFAAVERLAQLANEHAVDAVGGGGRRCSHAQTCPTKTLPSPFQLLPNVPGRRMAADSGNHDAALAESVWTRAQRLQCVPAHVQLLLGCPSPRIFASVGFAAAAPRPLRQAPHLRHATAWMDTADTPAGLLRIGLAHGQRARPADTTASTVTIPTAIGPSSQTLSKVDREKYNCVAFSFEALSKCCCNIFNTEL